MTFHRAKGLEWQVVFVTGLERGLVPISWAGHADARAEERRLLHVALGRAEDWVALLVGAGAHGARSAGRPDSPARGSATLEQAIDRVPRRARRPQGARRHDALAALERAAPPAPTSHARRDPAS